MNNKLQSTTVINLPVSGCAITQTWWLGKASGYRRANKNNEKQEGWGQVKGERAGPY